MATLSEGVHALVHEATFLLDQIEYARATKHSTAEDAGKIAEEAKAKKLFLTHLSPLNDGRDKEHVKEARSAYHGEVTVGRDLLKVRIRAWPTTLSFRVMLERIDWIRGYFLSPWIV